MSESTGYIRVTMKSGYRHYLPARTYAEAASLVLCASGHITRFDHITKDEYDLAHRALLANGRKISNAFAI